MEITVVGAGYVGLVTGVAMAALGHRVQLVEREPGRRRELEAGRIPIAEPALQDLLAEHRESLSISAEVPGDGPSELTLVAVGTPFDGDEADLSQLRSVADAFRRWPVAHVSVRCTLPPGTSLRLPELFGRPDGRHLSTNPEFLRQGSGVEDFLAPSRIVVGRFRETTDEHLGLLEGAYRRVPGPRLVVDVAAAELIKNAANAFLALKLSFVNEVAALADAYGADVDSVLAGIALDRRIGSSHMQPGLGFGGSCLPKELEALAVAGNRMGLDMHVARAAAVVNEEQQDRFARDVLTTLPTTGARVALLGLSFKASTDDIRGSPAVRLARRLLLAGHAVVAYDPAVRPADAMAALPGLELTDAAGDAFDRADAVVVATEWPQFMELDWASLRARMRGDRLFDGRNLLDPAVLSAAGYVYRGIGRRTAGEPVAAS